MTALADFQPSFLELWQLVGLSGQADGAPPTSAIGHKPSLPFARLVTASGESPRLTADPPTSSIRPSDGERLIPCPLRGLRRADSQCTKRRGWIAVLSARQCCVSRLARHGLVMIMWKNRIIHMMLAIF